MLACVPAVENTPLDNWISVECPYISGSSDVYDESVDWPSHVYVVITSSSSSSSSSSLLVPAAGAVTVADLGLVRLVRTNALLAHGYTTTNLLLCNGIKIFSALQRLHGEIGCTISDVQRRDGQTDIETDKNNST